MTKLEKGAFGRLPVVFELNLAHNNINNITSRAFDGLIQILTLNLTNNNITHIPNGALQGKLCFSNGIPKLINHPKYEKPSGESVWQAHICHKISD